MATAGTDLLQQIMSGDLTQAPPETVFKVRELVSPALAEIIDQGCRVRPLLLAGDHIGFVRGVHTGERKQLFTWFPSPEDRIAHLISLGTTLTPGEVNDLDGYEAQAIIRLIDRCTDADTSLLPYLNAFATTSTSDILWQGRGRTISAWSNRIVELPGDWSLKLIAPPEHSRIWATVAAYRERSKQRLDDTYNAAMITRALAGKGADRIFNSLKKTQASLVADTTEPWMDVVKMDLADVNFGDGWGHAHQDDTVGGMLREMEGMDKLDRHEQVMNDIYRQHTEAAQVKHEEMERRFEAAMKWQGMEDSMTILSSVEVVELDRKLAAVKAATDNFLAHELGASRAADDAAGLRARRAAMSVATPRRTS